MTGRTPLPKAWSKSGLKNLLDGCAWQWYLSKVVGLEDAGSPATVRGTALHAAIEHHERARLVMVRDGVGTVPSFGACLDVGLTALEEQAARLPAEQWDLHRTSPQQVADDLGYALENWWAHPLPPEQDYEGRSLRERLLSLRPVAVEPYFRVTDDRVQRPTHGFIDEVLYDHDWKTWVVVDHKTAGTFDRWHLSGVGHEVEAAVYVAGALAARGLPVAGEKVRMEWHIVRPRQATSRTGALARLVAVNWDGNLAADWTVAEVARAEQTVAAEAFPTNPGWNLCSAKWCAFHEGCQVTGDLSPERIHGGAA